MSSLHRLKRSLESVSGLHIYRSTLPHGTDLIFDLRRVGFWPEDPVVLDIGAHTGQTAHFFLEVNPDAEIHCFEPSSSNYKILQASLGGRSGVHLWKMALGGESGVATLHLMGKSTTHSLVNVKGATSIEKVEIDTVDAFCLRQQIGRVHFCKVDTEGADLDVLKGATDLLKRHLIDFVQVETSTRKDVSVFAKLDEIDSFLAGLGYEVFGFYDQQPCWSGRQSLLYFNAVYVRSSMLADVPPLV